ncbi:MAG: 2-dehydropantoate 2-reductase [Anaerolineae bacterium]
MRIAIWGLGAVGGYFGARLAQTQHDVVFIARGEHLRAIQTNGLTVDSDYGSFVVHPALATDDAASVGAVDLVVLATKTWQVEESAAAMRPLIGAHTIILPLLNGVEAPHTLAEVYGEPHVLGGFCRVQSRREAAGHIVQGGTEPVVTVGVLHGGARDERVQQVAAVFTEAGVKVDLPESIEAAMWQKLLFIAAFGGVGAVTRMPAGIIRTLSETRQLLLEAMQEACDVAVGRGVPMAVNAVERGMAMMDALPEGATASMQRDIMSGLPSELDAQNGAVVRLGRAVGIPTPVHRFIYHCLLPMEQQARAPH